MGRKGQFRKGRIPFNKGKHLSKLHRQHVKAGLKKFYRNKRRRDARLGIRPSTLRTRRINRAIFDSVGLSRRLANFRSGTNAPKEIVLGTYQLILRKVN